MTGLLRALPVSGIRSKQPWFVMSAAKYSTHINSANPFVSHYYSFEADGHHQHPIAIPDGCVDLLFDCDQNEPIAQVCGTALQAKEIQFERGHRYFGVRFLPGYIPDFLDVSAKEIIDNQIDFLDIMPRAKPIFEQVVEQTDFAKQVAIVSQFLHAKTASRLSPLTRQLVGKICQQQGNIQVQQLERYSGYCSRTIQRQFLAETGQTPKAFCRAIRCQSAVYNINHSPQLAFSDLASELGFSDQSHFLREFKKLVSTTPLEYQHRVQHKTYLERIHCY